jgi:two-component system chemotaxis response regulator CheB
VKPVRVLIVDDSALVRSILARRLTEAGLEVVGVAADPFVARELILLKKPDVLTLDLEMPRMDGLTFLDRLMNHYPMPVVVLSSLTESRGEMALRALELGALDVIAKPSGGVTDGFEGASLDRLFESVCVAGEARPRRRRLKTPERSGLGKMRNPIETNSDRVVAIGASTGGTEALAELLESLPPDNPGVLIVQHMPSYFTKTFAQRLDKNCSLRVREARTGDEVKNGTVLIAPGDFHMILRRTGARYHVECRQGPLVHHVRPSVDVLFHSVAQAAGPEAVGVLLTGMGKDGAAGLLSMRMAGASTLAQDQESCVVYGMPKEAVACGAVKEIVPLNRMAEAIQSKIKKMASTAAAVKG